MNLRQITHSRFQANGAAAQARGRNRAGAAESGPKLVLYGWIVAMIGIVFYSIVMLGGEPQADIMDALAARGALGWCSLAVIGIGVSLWFAGSWIRLRAGIVQRNADESGRC